MMDSNQNSKENAANGLIGKVLDLKGNSKKHFLYFKKHFDYELKRPGDILLELGNYDIKTRDLVLLSKGNWLNDMIINYFGMLLIQPSFKKIALDFFPNKSLYSQKFQIWNTFVSVNMKILDEKYLEYKDGREDSVGVTPDPRLDKDVYLEWACGLDNSKVRSQNRRFEVGLFAQEVLFLRAGLHFCSVCQEQSLDAVCY